MEEAGKNVVMGGVGKPDVSPVLKFGDTGGPVVQVIVLDSIRRNDAGGGGNTCGVLRQVTRKK